MIENTASPKSSDVPRLHRKLQVWLVRGLAIVGAIWIGAAAISWLVKVTNRSWSSERPSATLFSPGGHFKTTVYLSYGGGPATSYCGTSIYVGASGASDADVRVSQNRVYDGACGGLCEGHWEQNLKWKSESEFEIDFDPSAATTDGEAMIRGSAVGGKVRISYHALIQNGCSF